VTVALALVGLADRAKAKPSTSAAAWSGASHRRGPGPRPRHPDLRRADRGRRSAEPQRHYRQPPGVAPARQGAALPRWRRPSASATGSSSWTTARSWPATPGASAGDADAGGQGRCRTHIGAEL